MSNLGAVVPGMEQAQDDRTGQFTTQFCLSFQ